MTNDELLTQDEVAAILKVSAHTLINWRRPANAGGLVGPPFVRIGASIRYRRSDLDRWIESRTLNGTLPV